MEEDYGPSWEIVMSLAGTRSLGGERGRARKEETWVEVGDKNCHVVCWPQVTWETAKRRR